MGFRTLVTRSAVMAAVSLMLPAAAPAQSEHAGKAGVVTNLQGTATVARTTAAQPAALKFRDDVFVHDRITTGDESRARILLGGKAVVTVRERSQLTITENATTSTLEVTRGAIALSVNKARMNPGDSVEIKTPNAVAGIRGTVIIAEVEQPEAAPVSTRFTLLTGIVDVTLLDPTTGRATGPALTLKPLQTVSVTGFTPPAAARPITRAEADRAAAGFTAPLREPSAGANSQIVDDQVQEAAKRATALSGGTDKGKADDRPAGDRDKSKGKDDGDRSGGASAGGGSSSGGGSTSGGGASSGSGSVSGGGSASGGGAVSGGDGGGNGNGGRNNVLAGGGSTGGVGGKTGGGTGGSGVGGVGPGDLRGGGGIGGNGGNGGLGGDDIRGRDNRDRKLRDRVLR
jgi:uncharacterized membrane protein YgcG